MIEVLHFTAELPVTSGQLSIEASKEEIKQIVLGKNAIKNQKQSPIEIKTKTKRGISELNSPW